MAWRRSPQRPPAGGELEPHNGFPAMRVPPRRTAGGIAAARLLPGRGTAWSRSPQRTPTGEELEPHDGFPTGRAPPRRTAVATVTSACLPPEKSGSVRIEENGIRVPYLSKWHKAGAARRIPCPAGATSPERRHRHHRHFLSLARSSSGRKGIERGSRKIWARVSPLIRR